MVRVTRLLIVCVAMAMLAAACGDDSASTTTAPTSTTTTTAGTTTAPATTTTTTASTTTGAPALFTADDLPAAVLHDGDPWVVPVVGAEPFEITIDDVWPAEEFPEDRVVYENAGYVTGSFSLFAEDDGIVITGAHLFGDEAGAAAAFDLIESSFSDTELVAQITGLAPGSLTMTLTLAPPPLGDRAAGVLLTGPEVQVVGVIWTTGNLLQFVRAGMSLGDETRAAAVIDVAVAMEDRLGS